MKYGIHLSSYCKRWKEDLSPYVSLSKELGFDGVEFPLLDPNSFPVSEMKRLLKKEGLGCTVGTGLTADKDITSLNPSVRKAGIDHIIKCLEISHDLGSDCLGGVIYTPWGETGDRNLWPERYKLGMNALIELASKGKMLGVTMALEILNRYESSFLNTIEEGKSFIDELQGAPVKLHLDTFHANIEEKDIKKALLLGGDTIYHIHVAENTRGIPGTGSIDWTGFKEGIESIGYNRWITLEGFVMPNTEVGNDTFVWRNIEENGEKFAEEGLGFMKRLFEA
jgi:D-psicose/D-tagatose/L-ribulose 3-epimerase